MQIKASFKKEWMFFSRTFKMIGVTLAIFAFAVVDPVMYKVLAVAMDMIDNQTSQTQSSVSDTTSDDTSVNLSSQIQQEQASQEQDSFSSSMSVVFGGEMQMGVYGTASEITTTSTLIILLLLMAAAGGEQKKRSTIIPNCAGLSVKNYILPKFILYPLFTVLETFLAVILSYGVSLLLFTGEMAFIDVILTAACAGLFQGFIVVVFLTFGVCTSRPGIGTIIIYVATSLVPIILAQLGGDKYNPFALKTMMMASAENVDMKNFIVSVAITLIACVILYFVTMLVLSARRIDNSGAEVEL